MPTWLKHSSLLWASKLLSINCDVSDVTDAMSIFTIYSCLQIHIKHPDTSEYSHLNLTKIRNFDKNQRCSLKISPQWPSFIKSAYAKKLVYAKSDIRIDNPFTPNTWWVFIFTPGSTNVCSMFISISTRNKQINIPHSPKNPDAGWSPWWFLQHTFTLKATQ